MEIVLTSITTSPVRVIETYPDVGVFVGLIGKSLYIFWVSEIVENIYVGY